MIVTTPGFTIEPIPFGTERRVARGSSAKDDSVSARRRPDSHRQIECGRRREVAREATRAAESARSDQMVVRDVSVNVPPCDNGFRARNDGDIRRAARGGSGTANAKAATSRRDVKRISPAM